MNQMKLAKQHSRGKSSEFTGSNVMRTDTRENHIVHFQNLDNKDPDQSLAPWELDMMMMDQQSEILEINTAKMISEHLPSRLRGYDWRLAYRYIYICVCVYL